MTTTTTKTLNIQWERTLHFMIKGFGEGLLWTLWYRNAERWTMHITRVLTAGRVTNNVVHTFVATTVAILLDLVLACPVIYAAWDIPLPALLRGTPISQIPQRIRDKIGGLLLASVKVWTPVNILIYNAPVQYRVYINSFADVFWQSIVSSIVSTSAVVAVLNDEAPTAVVVESKVIGVELS